MRRKEKEIISLEEIETAINKAISCRLALVDDGKPYIVPVCFGYERNALYFHGALEGRKRELIPVDNKVCFQMDADVETVEAESTCGWTIKYRSVIGTGRAPILRSDDEERHGLRVISKQYGKGDSSFPKVILDNTLVIKIDIESLTGKQSGY
jgi:uncharacterized protein